MGLDIYNFSRDLGIFELRRARAQGFPPIIDRAYVDEVRQALSHGQSGYIRGEKMGKPVMISLEPNIAGVLARVVPTLHFISGHYPPRANMRNSSQIEALKSILTEGFRSSPQDDNAFLLTSNYENETWMLGYPLGEPEITPLSQSYAMTARVSGMEVVGDSARVLLWTGVDSAKSYPKIRRSRVAQNTTSVYSSPIGWVEGVVVTAPGSDFDQRINFYQNFYTQNGCVAPLHVYNQFGERVTIE